MTERLRLLFRNIVYNLRGGFLVRPLTIALALGCAGGAALLGRGVLSGFRQVGTAGAIPLSRRRPPGISSHPRGNRRLHHDGRFHRVRHPADDPYPGLDAVLSAHHRQLLQRPRNAVDAGHISGNILVLHGCAAGRAFPAPAVRARGYCHGRNFSGHRLRGLAAVFHSPHIAGHQRESHRGQDRVRNRTRD